LLGEPLGYERALASPVGDGSTIVGVVFAAIDATQVEERAVAAAGTFAKLASAAVEQAHLVEDARDRDGRAG
jgi:GAF domain-containing protein